MTEDPQFQPLPEVYVQVSEPVRDPQTDPHAAAIWDRAFVSEPKNIELVTGPDATPVTLADDRGLPTVAVRTGELDAWIDQRRSRRRLVLAIGVVLVLLGSGAAIFSYRYWSEQQGTQELAQALHRSGPDTVAANLEAVEALEGLSRTFSERSDVVDALAGRSALYALRFDPSGAALARASRLAGEPGDREGLTAARAAAALLGGDRDRAEKIASAGLAGHARGAQLAYVRARIRLEAAQPDAAISDLTWAEGIDPHWSAPLALHADAERQAGRLVDARETLAELGRVAPHSTELPVVQALVGVDAALITMLPEALGTARRAIQSALATSDSRAPGLQARLRLGLARLDLASGEATRALETLGSVRSLLARSPEFLRLEALARSAAGAPVEALAGLEASPPDDAEARWIRALLLLQLERPEAALASGRSLGRAAAPGRLALLRGGAAWLSLDAAAAARELATASVAGPADPGRDEADLIRVEALSETGTWNEVRAAALALGSRPTRQCAQAILLSMWGNEPRAREGLAALSEARPVCASRLEGRLALAAGDTEAALVHLRRAAAAGKPSDRVALAQATWRQRGATEALVEARRALEARPSAARTLLPLVDLLSRLGAAAEARRAVELAPEGPLRASLLARSRRLLGDLAGAAEVLRGAPEGPMSALEAAQAALARHDRTAALDASGRAIGLPGPLGTEALRARAQALQEAGRDTQVKTLIETELTLAAGRGDRRRIHALRLLRARLSLDRGDSVSLRQAANDLSFLETRMHVPSAERQVLLGRLSAMVGERSEAARLFRAALTLDAAHMEAFEGLAALEALTDAERAARARAFPERPEIH